MRRPVSLAVCWLDNAKQSWLIETEVKAECVVRAKKLQPMGRGCGIIAGNQTKRKVMNDKFDELAKDLGKSITRRRALWRFGAGVLGGLIAVAGLTNRANANPNPNACRHRCYNRCR